LRDVGRSVAAVGRERRVAPCVHDGLGVDRAIGRLGVLGLHASIDLRAIEVGDELTSGGRRADERQNTDEQKRAIP
jgi:hypothetical protein